MKKLLGLILVLGLFLNGALAGDFIQVSSSISQSASEPTVVMIDQVDAAGGMFLVNDSALLAVTPGYYQVIASPQFAGSSSSQFRCWLRVNGQDLENSNVLATLRGGVKDVIVVNAIVFLDAADYLEIVIAGGDIEAIQPEAEPLVPSIIVSVFQVD